MQYPPRWRRSIPRGLLRWQDWCLRRLSCSEQLALRRSCACSAPKRAKQHHRTRIHRIQVRISPPPPPPRLPPPKPTPPQPQKLVFHANQVESAGNSSRTCSAAVPAFQNTRDIVHPQTSFADLQQGADKVADHVVQKPLPRTVNIISSGVRAQNAEWIVRTLVGAVAASTPPSSIPEAMRALRSGSEAAKEVKSCVPTMASVARMTPSSFMG